MSEIKGRLIVCSMGGKKNKLLARRYEAGYWVIAKDVQPEYAQLFVNAQDMESTITELESSLNALRDTVTASADRNTELEAQLTAQNEAIATVYSWLISDTIFMDFDEIQLARDALAALQEDATSEPSQSGCHNEQTSCTAPDPES